jgi:prevent-host-death family protein
MCYTVDMSTVSVRDLRNHTAEVIARAEAGESIILTVNGTPKLRLVPIKEADDWLATLVASPPGDSGLLAYLESSREVEMSLDWGDE